MDPMFLVLLHIDNDENPMGINKFISFCNTYNLKILNKTNKKNSIIDYIGGIKPA